jgi:hypothetical protein
MPSRRCKLLPKFADPSINKDTDVRFPQSSYASDFPVGEICRELEPEEVPVAIRQTSDRGCKMPLLFLSRRR